MSGLMSRTYVFMKIGDSWLMASVVETRVDALQTMTAALELALKSTKSTPLAKKEGDGAVLYYMSEMRAVCERYVVIESTNMAQAWMALANRLDEESEVVNGQVNS